MSQQVTNESTDTAMLDVLVRGLESSVKTISDQRAKRAESTPDQEQIEAVDVCLLIYAHW